MADDFFGNDPFEEIVREFLGGNSRRGRRTVVRGEEEERNIDFIEGNDKVYAIFELPGFDENDVDISIKGKELEITAQKQSAENVQAYLSQKLSQGSSIRRTLPEFVNPKKYDYTMKNGVLEIKFNKK